MPEVTVLLRTLNASEYLDSLLGILAAQTVPAELLVVDSQSTDGTPERCRQAGARVVTIPRARFTHARSTNLGFREARGEFVAMLSQDALPRRIDWLETFLPAFRDPDVAAAFGRQIPRPGCFPLERWELERCYPESGEPAVVYSNVNSMARRSVWEEHPFDESVLIAEDRFWALTIRETGKRIHYVPEADVLHSHTYTLRGIYDRCRAEARARHRAEGDSESWTLLWKGWPKQTVRDARRLQREGDLRLWPRAAAYRFSQFAGLLAGGRS